MAQLTAILTAYRRPALLAEQLEAIRSQTFAPREIWLWANEPRREMHRDQGPDFDRVFTCNRNAGVHARFAHALSAPTEFVALFDDDTMPGRRWLENCRETFRRQPGILGSAGVCLHDVGYMSRSVHGWHDPVAESVEVDLVGHAWFLKTEWIHWLFSAPAVTGTNGEDIELSARAWRHAGIRTFCPPHPPRDKDLWGSLQGVALGDDPVALSRRSSHLEERNRIVRAEINADGSHFFNGNQLPHEQSPQLQVPLVLPEIARSRSARQDRVDRVRRRRSSASLCREALTSQGPGRISRGTESTREVGEHLGLSTDRRDSAKPADATDVRNPSAAFTLRYRVRLSGTISGPSAKGCRHGVPRP